MQNKEDVKPGMTDYKENDLDALKKGIANLEKHIENYIICEN